MIMFWQGCLVACLLGCAYAHPAKQQTEKTYVTETKMSDLESSASGYIYKNVPAVKYAELINGGLEEFQEAPLAVENAPAKQYVLLPLAGDPDAEMLPAHYTQVKPPGVDHMEISFLEPSSLGTHSSPLIEGSEEADAAAAAAKATEFEKGGGKKFAAEKHGAKGAKGEKGYKKTEEFEEAQKGEHDKENHSGHYDEAAGKKKSHDETEGHFKGHKEAAGGAKGGSFELEGAHKKGHNTAGYHNVYHKDEYKKDSDFYDSDHKGGQFKKHGHYGEKHASTEGAYKKGGSHDSGFAEAEAGKEGKFAKGHENEAKKGHAAKEGYEGFFGNFEEFAKKGGAAEGKKYGFSSGDAEKAR